MKKQKTVEQEPATIEDVLEQYKILRTWHKTAYIAAIVMICCMIGFVAWGIFFAELRLLLISFGIVLGVCGAVLYVMMHRIYVKTGAAILDYFKASGMSEQDLMKKAEELRIKIRKTAKTADRK